ncbi:MAG: polysaccharide biosynthesis protein [Bacteroidetes bacterium]|nr:MAG: polysaccharide biosynthesis protein [Bacteroidota bacterium]
MSLLKKLAGETALYGLSSILGRFLNYLLVPVYTRTLTKVENGVLTELYAYSAFLIVILSYRMESALFRFGTQEEDRERAYSTALLSLFASTLAITLGVLLAAQPLADVLAYSSHPEYIRWFALILAFDCLAELPFARLRLEQRPIRFVTGKLFNIGLTVTLNLFWLVFCPWAAKEGIGWVHYVWSPDIRVGYVFLANLISSSATFLYLFPQVRRFSWPVVDGLMWRRMLLYAAPLILVQFAGIINSMFDRAMQKWLLPGTPEENLANVGIYGNIYKLAMLITIFTQAYRYAAEPFFFRHANDANAPELQARVTKWFTIVSAIGMLGVLLYIDIVKYFLAEPYWVGLFMVPILLLANVLLGLYYNLSVWYRLKDKTHIGALISIAGALCTVLLNLWWVPKVGYVGSAWAALISYALMCLLAWSLGRKYYAVPYEFGRMGGYLLLVLGLYALSMWWKIVAPGQLVLSLVLNTVLFAGFLVMVLRLEKVQLKR